MAGQPEEHTKDKMDTTAETVYDEWRSADGLFNPESSAKTISFKDGFVRVRKQDWASIVDEGWAGNVERTFKVPPWHYCEVLGSAQIKFAKA
ncbi:hypothetical protein B0J14DRAFT_489630 [Halenospora varia]|nr:hypothetical protein B0J14DRAFT_489630 [Halenospora varia]